MLDEIYEELFHLNYNSEIKKDKIYWKDSFGAENYIDINYTDEYNNNLAWWKFNEGGKDLVMFTRGNFVINWHPLPLNNMGMSSGCIYLKFSREILVVAYQDKHCQRVFSINTINLDYKQIYYCQKVGLSVHNDMLYIKDFNRNEYFFFNLHIPLIEKHFCQEQSLKVNQISLYTSDGVIKY